MLLDVITRVSADTGLHLEQSRSILVDLANRAAAELHRKLECNKIYRETTLTVPVDAVVSLPAFIGDLRGMRMHTRDVPFDLRAIGSPRYISTSQEYLYDNWRDLGESSLEVSLAAVGPLRFEVDTIESTPSVISITGQTNKAARREEKITMSSTSVITTKLFGPRIDSIACFTPRLFDINVFDSTDQQVATLYNHQNKTRYKKVDVSRLCWSADTSANESLIDIVYKVPYTRLINDSDSFPGGDDFDEAWYYYTMGMYLAPMQDRKNDANVMLSTAMAAVSAAKESGDSGIEKKFTFGRNKFFGLFRSTSISSEYPL